MEPYSTLLEQDVFPAQFLFPRNQLHRLSGVVTTAPIAFLNSGLGANATAIDAANQVEPDLALSLRAAGGHILWREAQGVRNGGLTGRQDYPHRVVIARRPSYVSASAQKTGLPAASQARVVIEAIQTEDDLPAVFREAIRITMPGGIVVTLRHGRPILHNPHADDVVAAYYDRIGYPSAPEDLARRAAIDESAAIAAGLEPHGPPFELTALAKAKLRPLLAYIKRQPLVARFEEAHEWQYTGVFQEKFWRQWGGPKKERDVYMRVTAQTYFAPGMVEAAEYSPPGPDLHARLALAVEAAAA